MFGTHRYVHGEIGPFAVDAQASPNGAVWSAWHQGGLRVVLMVSMIDRAYTLEEIQNDVEPRLRKLHDDLTAHFAPVLRWERDMHSVAYLGPWMLEADSEEWSVRANGVVVASGERCTTRESNRLAAEAALRRLGVVFRTEGE